MKIHPLADRFPKMNRKQFDDMKDDIAARGLQEKIVIFEGEILDGRHRYQACVELGWSDDQLREAMVERDDIADPLDFVMSANQYRRHMTQNQLAAVAAKMLKAANVSRGSKHQDVTAEQAAEAFAIGLSTVSKAKYVLDHGTPQEIDDLENGKINADTLRVQISRRRRGSHDFATVSDAAILERARLGVTLGSAAAGAKLGVHPGTINAAIRAAKERGLNLNDVGHADLGLENQPTKPKTFKQREIEALMRRRPFRGVPIEESGMPPREEMTQPDPNHPGRTKLMAHVAEHGLVQLWSPSEKAQHELATRLTELTVWLKRMVEGDFYFPTPADLDKADALTQKRFRNALARYLSPALTRLSELEERMRSHLDAGPTKLAMLHTN